VRRTCFFLLFAGVLSGLMSLTSAQSVPPAAALTPVEKAGRSLFQTRCAMCHVGGEATSEMATPAAAPRASTMGPLLSRANTTNEAALRQKIKDGSAQMPGYKYTFSDPQVDQVIAFIKTLDKPLTRLFEPNTYTFPAPGAEAGVLTGLIKSAAGAPVEGVAVSARLPGEPITTSVYTGVDGRFYFPPMKAGAYNVWAQAIGLERAESTATLDARTVKVDFTMRETTDLIPQLSGYQVIAALPEDTVAHRRGKALFQKNCTYCHETSASLRDRFDQTGWEVIVGAMTGGFSRNPRPLSPAMKELATYLTEMRGPGPSPMQPKVYRPKGEATLPVMYEYDVEYADGGYSTHNGSDWRYGHASTSGGGGAIHDAVLDWDGNFWFTSNRNSANRTIGRVDGKTGKTTNFAVPIDGGRMAQSHGILLGLDGRVYFNSSPRIPYLDGDLGIVDTKTQKVETVKPPDGWTRVSGWLGNDAKGRIWTASGMMQRPTGALRFDPKTKSFTLFSSPTATMTYGITGDIDGNGWWTGVNEDIMVYSDENDQPHEIKLPAQPWAEYLKPGDFADGEQLPQQGIGGKQSPRRPVADLKSTAVWIPNFYGNTVLRIDSRTKVLKYYPAPSPGMTPYEAAVDSQHRVWITFQNSDEMGLLNPETGSWTMYSWPTKGMAQRQNHMLERDGVLQFVSASGLSHRVGRMVMRSDKDVQALRARVQ